MLKINQKRSQRYVVNHLVGGAKTTLIVSPAEVKELPSKKKIVS